MNKFKYGVFYVLFLCSVLAVQAQKDITIGIITDINSQETNPLLEQLKTEIKAVVGQDASITFKDILENHKNQDLVIGVQKTP